MSAARFYEIGNLPLGEVANAAAGFFGRQDFMVNSYTDYNGRTIIQLNKQNGVRFIFGLAYSLTVVLAPQPDGRLLVELGGETWGDKIASGAVGVLLLPPLMFTAAYGAWQQSELDQNFWNFLDGFIYQRTGQPSRFYPATPIYNPGQTNWGQQNQGMYAPPPGANPNPSYSAYQNQYYGYAAQQPQPAAPTPPPYQYPQRTNWFDPTSSQPVFDQQVGRMASWQAAIADGVITPAELNAQQERVDKLQKMTDDRLDNDQKLLLAEAISEINKLEGLQRTALTHAYSKSG
jgi:hypothetical protein